MALRTSIVWKSEENPSLLNFSSRRFLQGLMNLKYGATMNMHSDRAPRQPGTILPHVERWAAIPLRAIVGYGFMAHGFAKVG